TLYHPTLSSPLSIIYILSALEPAILMPYILSTFFFFNHTATTEIYTLSLHDALPIFSAHAHDGDCRERAVQPAVAAAVESMSNRSEEHTSELQSQSNLVCRLLLEKKKKKIRWLK